MSFGPQDLDAVFHELCQEGPEEMLGAFDGAGAEFWYEPYDRPVRWSFGAVCGVARHAGKVTVGILTPPTFTARVIEVPVEMVRLTQDLHPALQRHLVAVRTAQVAHFYGGAALEHARNAVNAAAGAWAEAFATGLPGVRPVGAKVRAVDLRNLEAFGLFAADEVPGSGSAEIGG
ncbi:MAG: hypothetical protein ACYDGR_07205 [Candidatus Dormibacteria bacterium]